MGKTRRAIAEQADRVGFGRVIWVHRQRRDAQLPVGFLLFALIPAGVAIWELAVEEHSLLWRVPVLGYAVLMWAVVAWLW